MIHRCHSNAQCDFSDALTHAEVAVDDDRIRKVVLDHAKNCVTTIADHAF